MSRKEAPAGTSAEFKVKELGKGGAWQAYRSLMYGDMPLWKVLWAECLFFFLSHLGGPLGLMLRMKLYPSLFRHCGRKVVFGRGVLIRHPHKIDIGDGVVLDEGATVDAKGVSNHGITLGEKVYVGRQSTLYCKNGDMRVGARSSVSAHAILFSSNDLELGEDCVVASFAYILSGGEYDVNDPTPFALQKGTCTKGPTRLGRSVWVGTGAKVLDGASLGDRVVVAAGAVVTKPQLARAIVGGVPAKVLRVVDLPAPPPPSENAPPC